MHVGNIVGQLIGAIVGGAIGALLLQYATKWAAKFKPPFTTALLLVGISWAAGVAIDYSVVIPLIAEWFGVMILASAAAQIYLYAILLKHPETGPIGYLKAFQIFLILTAMGAVIGLLVLVRLLFIPWSH
ncbi:MAG: hypothetical protein FIA97_08305 [Methylococcaceae bacterium]|nr:hypothetical protein [Methylococcaceae bacterium]